MVCKETSIAEKIINHFPDENIVLSKTINGRKPGIWFKSFNFTVKVDEEDYEGTAHLMKKKEKTCLKAEILKTFGVIQMILFLILINV